VIAAILVAAIAAWFDWRSRRVPNALTLPVLIIACAYGGAGAILGVAVCSALPLLLWTRGVLGGGDVKLLAVLGAILGVRLGIGVEVIGLLLAMRDHTRIARPFALDAFAGVLLVAEARLLYP